jgi:tRNA U54 and U55 pseudouridine synthase Pus10
MTLVQVKGLQIVDKSYFDLIKSSENNKVKHYSAVVWTQNPISQQVINSVVSMFPMNIKQKTPIRVLHRRCLLERTKVIHKIKCNQINEHFMVCA